MTTQQDPFQPGARWCFITAGGDRHDYTVERHELIHVVLRNQRTGGEAWATRTWLESPPSPMGSYWHRLS